MRRRKPEWWSKDRTIYIDLDPEESSKDDDDDGKIRNQVVQDPKPRSEAYSQGLKSGPSGKIDHGKNERRSNISSNVERQSSGKYSAQLEDQLKRQKLLLGLFDTEEEAEATCRRWQLELDRRRSMVALARKDRIKHRSPDAAELSSHDDDGKIINRVVQDSKPCSEAYDQGLNSGQSGKIDRGKNPERQSTDSFSVVRHPCGKYYAEFKDPSKRRKVSLGMFDTEEEADLACRHKELEVFSRSMLAIAREELRLDKPDEVLLQDIKPEQSVDDPLQLVTPRFEIDASSSIKSQFNRTNNVVVEGGKDPPAIVASVEGALREKAVACEGVGDDDAEQGLLNLLEEPDLSPSALELLQDGDELDDETDEFVDKTSDWTEVPVIRLR